MGVNQGVAIGYGQDGKLQFGQLVAVEVVVSGPHQYGVVVLVIAVSPYHAPHRSLHRTSPPALPGVVDPIDCILSARSVVAIGQLDRDGRTHSFARNNAGRYYVHHIAVGIAVTIR